MQFASNFLHDCQQYGDSSVQLPLPFFQKLMKCSSHPCREYLSISNQGLEEVKYSGKCSSFLSSCQIWSIPSLVLLQDVFPENSHLSCRKGSLRDEEAKGGQNKIQAMTSLTEPSPAVPEAGKHSREWQKQVLLIEQWWLRQKQSNKSSWKSVWEIKATIQVWV